MSNSGFPSGHDPDHVPNVDHALGVETNVRRGPGEWYVEIDVLLADGVVHHRVGTYFTKRHAEIAASWIKRAAEREIEGPRRD